MSVPENLVGRRFGLLTVIRRDAGPHCNERVRWFCLCDCGSECSATARNLKRSHTKSCGCSSRALMSAARTRAAALNLNRIASGRVTADGSILLSDGSKCLVDSADLPAVSALAWHPTRRNGRTYARTTTGGRKVLMHVLLMGTQPGRMVDHKNGDGLDNRRENLRWATLAQNAQNSKARENKVGGYRGVSRSRRGKKWSATIRANGEYRYLGSYPTREDAAKAYDDAAKLLHGEFARLNFPATA